MNALAKPEVGEFINRYFVSSFQRVGTFKINNGQKQGGNVAAYFCAPDGRVLHVIAGPVNDKVFLEEAEWAVTKAQEAIGEAKGDAATFRKLIRKYHAERLETAQEQRGSKNRQPNSNKVDKVLVSGATKKIEDLYRTIFEDILGETVTTKPVQADTPFRNRK